LLYHPFNFVNGPAGCPIALSRPMNRRRKKRLHPPVVHSFPNFCCAYFLITLHVNLTMGESQLSFTNHTQIKLMVSLKKQQLSTRIKNIFFMFF